MNGLEPLESRVHLSRGAGTVAPAVVRPITAPAITDNST